MKFDVLKEDEEEDDVTCRAWHDETFVRVSASAERALLILTCAK